MSFQPIRQNIEYPYRLTDDDQSLLWEVANLAALAYKDGSRLMEHWKSVRASEAPTADRHHNVLKHIETIDLIEDREKGLQAFACEYKPQGYPDTVLAVVVRGSSDIKDFLTDIRARQIDFGSNSNGERQEGVRVHKGFHQQYGGLMIQFGSRITDNLQKGRVVLFSGHSLGAAVATMLAMNYASFKESGKVWLVVFGSPTVGNDKFAQRLEQDADLLWRVKNGRDPVTKVPSKFLGYKHAGSEIHLGDDDPFPDIAFLWDIDDHDFNKYVANLNRNGEAPAVTPGNIIDAIRRYLDALHF